MAISRKVIAFQVLMSLVFILSAAGIAIADNWSMLQAEFSIFAGDGFVRPVMGILNVPFGAVSGLYAFLMIDVLVWVDIYGRRSAIKV